MPGNSTFPSQAADRHAQVVQFYSSWDNLEGQYNSFSVSSHLPSITPCSLASACYAYILLTLYLYFHNAIASCYCPYTEPFQEPQSETSPFYHVYHTCEMSFLNMSTTASLGPQHSSNSANILLWKYLSLHFLSQMATGGQQNKQGQHRITDFPRSRDRVIYFQLCWQGTVPPSTGTKGNLSRAGVGQMGRVRVSL